MFENMIVYNNDNSEYTIRDDDLEVDIYYSISWMNHNWTTAYSSIHIVSKETREITGWIAAAAF